MLNHVKSNHPPYIFHGETSLDRNNKTVTSQNFSVSWPAPWPRQLCGRKLVRHGQGIPGETLRECHGVRYQVSKLITPIGLVRLQFPWVMSHKKLKINQLSIKNQDGSIWVSKPKSIHESKSINAMNFIAITMKQYRLMMICVNQH